MARSFFRPVAAVLMVIAIAYWSSVPATGDVEPNGAKHRAEQIVPGTYEGHVGASATCRPGAG